MIKGIIITSVVIGGIIGFFLFALYCSFVVGSRSDGDDDEN
jgi:hypothetical protein